MTEPEPPPFRTSSGIPPHPEIAGQAADGGAADAEKRTERPHPLTPLIRGWVVLLAIVLGVGREFVPDGTETDGGGLPPWQLLISGVGLIALLAVIAGFVSWRFTRFVVDADELRIDTGAVFRTSQRIAFERVQAIDVVQPFAARLFGLAELQIDIGGGESTKLRYLGLKRAYELRDYLLARARGHRVDPREAQVELSTDSRLSDLHAGDEVLVRIEPQALILAAFTSHEFFMILLAGLIPLGVAIWFDLGWVSIGLLLPVGSALIGFITRRVTGQFNYTLSRRPAGLRITRGLASLTSQSLPTRRVQAVQISQSLIWRRLGLYRIDLEVVGWGAVTDDENTKDVSTIMLPAGTAEQVKIALSALWPSADHEQVTLEPAPKAARRLHPFTAPFLRWGFDEQLFVARHGWLVRRWQVVPLARAQSVRVSQGPVSRRLGLVDVAVHTAGMHLSVRAEGADAATLRSRLAELSGLLRHRGADVTDLPSPPVEPGPS